MIFLFLNAVLKGNFHIEYDRGYPEMFGYFKELASAVILLWIGVKTRSPIILIIFAMIILAFADDVFMFHEGIGLQLSQALNLSESVDGEGIRGRDIGEVIYILAVGLFFLGLGAIFYFREKSSWCRDTVHGVVIVMVTLVFFSVGMDTADHFLKSTH